MTLSAKKLAELTRLQEQLSSPSFSIRAPSHVVDSARARCEVLLAESRDCPAPTNKTPDPRIEERNYLYPASKVEYSVYLISGRDNEDLRVVFTSLKHAARFLEIVDSGKVAIRSVDKDN